MKRRQFKNLDDWARRGMKEVEKDSHTLVREFRRAMAIDLGEACYTKTPRGDSTEAAKRQERKGGDPVYGHAKDRWFVDYDGRRYKISGRSSVVSALRSGLGSRSRAVRIPSFGNLRKKIKIGNDAAHARILDSGYGRSKPYKFRKLNSSSGEGSAEAEGGKLKGSPKIPRGIGKPVVESLMSKINEIGRKAADSTDRAR